MPGPGAEQTDILCWKVFLPPASPVPTSTLGVQRRVYRHSEFVLEGIWQVVQSPRGALSPQGWFLGSAQQQGVERYPKLLLELHFNPKIGYGGGKVGSRNVSSLISKLLYTCSF